MPIKKYHRVALKVLIRISPMYLAGFARVSVVHLVRYHRDAVLFGFLMLFSSVVILGVIFIAIDHRQSMDVVSSNDSDMEIANDCAHVTELNAICVDRAQRRIYVGTGTGFVAIDDLPEEWKEVRIKDNGIHIDCGEQLNLPFQKGRTFAHEEYQQICQGKH